MRECLPRAIRNRPEPRYNKGGAIVVKSTESLNSWYRSFAAAPFPLPCPFHFLLTDPSRCYPSYARTKLPRERWKRPFSLSSRPRRTLRLRDVHSRVRVSFGRQSGAPLSLSRSPKRESIMPNPAESNETRWYSKVQILTEYARWNCCLDSAFSFCTFQRSHYCGIWGFVYPFSATYTWEFEKYLDSWDFLNM